MDDDISTTIRKSMAQEHALHDREAQSHQGTPDELAGIEVQRDQSQPSVASSRTRRNPEGPSALHVRPTRRTCARHVEVVTVREEGPPWRQVRFRACRASTSCVKAICPWCRLLRSDRLVGHCHS